MTQVHEFALPDGSTFRSIEAEMLTAFPNGTPPEAAHAAFGHKLEEVIETEHKVTRTALARDKGYIGRLLTDIKPGHDYMVIDHKLTGKVGVCLRREVSNWMRSQGYKYELQWPTGEFYLTSSRKWHSWGFPTLIAVPNALFYFKLKWM